MCDLFSRRCTVVAQEEIQTNKDENLLSELNQLSLTDDDLEANLQKFEDLEPSEISH